jgi:membrane protein
MEFRVRKVLSRFQEINGTHLAGAVTLAGFLSLFPLLLIGVAVLGWFAASTLDLADDIAARFGLAGPTADLVRDAVNQARDTRGTVSAIGFATLVWSGLRVVAAMQFALNAPWDAGPPRGVHAKLVGLAWLVGAGAIFVASLVGGAAAARFLPRPFAPAWLGVSFLVDVALWLWTFTVLTNNHAGWRDHLPGAVVAAAGTGLLKALGSVWLPKSVASASALYGSIGVIFAVLVWFLLFGRLVVLAATVNAVRRAPAESPARPEPSAPRVPRPTGSAARLVGG